MKRLVLLAAGLALGCTPSGLVQDKPLGPAIVLTPPAPAPAPPRAATGTLSPAAVVRDTAALRGQATRYVVRRDSNPAVIDQLTTLTLQARRAVERMQAMRTRAGYRQGDVIAARTAADSLAAFLQTQRIATPAASAESAAPAAPAAVPASEAQP